MTVTYKELNFKREPWALQFDQSWKDQLKAEPRFCNLCGSMRIRDMSQPLTVVLRKPPLECNDFSGTIWGVSVLKRDLLSAIQRSVPEVEWCIGRCVLGDGTDVGTHCTAFTTGPVQLRHYPSHSIAVCPTCRTVRTRSSSTKPYYLMDHEVHARRLVVDRIGAIFVSADVAGAVQLTSWPGLYWQDIEVKRLPEDGLRLSGDPPYIVGKEVQHDS